MRRAAIAVSGLVITAGAVTMWAAGGDDASPGTDGTRTVGGGEQHVIPSPEAGQRELLLSDLRALNPALAGDEDRAVEDARWLCVDIRRGQPEDALLEEASQRFRVTWEQAPRVLDAVRGSFC
ncbi:hypothetical protein AB0L35_19295 [Streptomyces sp. NPDC052309]|uniref:hypothetical protein n=1 Tax=Streptomyces sp. NPDC052309 TaxID=3155421 RepID=UPI0034424568